MRRAVLIAALLCWSGALAQADLARFLGPLAAHPRAQAAAAGVAAARSELTGAYEPFSLNLSAGVNAFAYDAAVPPGAAPESAGRLDAELVLKPWPLPEQIDQRQLALVQAELDYREALAGLEAEALEAALQVQLGELSLALARQGLAVSERALAATRRRAELGAASARDLRDAEAGLAEAQAAVLDAGEGLALAQLALAQLIPGPASLDVGALQLVLPSGTPAMVVRAELGRAGAALGLTVTERGLLPILQAGYSWNVGERSTLGVGVETRTLQPRVTYGYQDPGRTPPASAVTGSFQVGLSMSISPASLAAAEAAERQLAAAERGLQAARAGAALQREALELSLGQAERRLAAAQARADNAHLALTEAETRERLGVASPLEAQQAALARTQAALELASARQAVFARALDFYRFYALPLTEVLK